MSRFMKQFSGALKASFSGFVMPVVMVFFAADALSSATYLTFTPRKVSGSVLYWTATGGTWLPVREGVPIPERTLVQVGSKSRVVLEIESQSDIRGKNSSVIEASITTPMVFRVERDLVRKMKINRKAFATAAVQPEFEVVAMGILGDLAHGHFREAFDSLVELASGGEISGETGALDDGPAEPADEGRLEAPVGRGSTPSARIKVLHPVSNARMHFDELPGYFRIFWEMPDAERDAEAQVFFWPEGENQGPPVAITRDRQYNLLVRRPGIYNLQLATAKWTAKSGIKRLYVHEATSQMEIEPTMPPRNFVFATDAKPVRIPFSWDARHTPPEALTDGKLDFEIVLAPDEKGPARERVYRVSGGDAAGGSTVLSLNKRGRFVWYVRAGGVDSPRYKFTITTPPAIPGVIADARGRQTYVFFDKTP